MSNKSYFWFGICTIAVCIGWVVIVWAIGDVPLAIKNCIYITFLAEQRYLYWHIWFIQHYKKINLKKFKVKLAILNI